MKITSVVVALALTGGAAAAQPWIPAECQTRYESRWGEFARAMRAAKPDSQIYAPRPYPQKDAEVIEDFKYGYWRMLKGLSPGEVAKEEWPLASALDNNTLAFRVLRVENWAPDRCRPDQQRDYSYLLYLTDTVTGALAELDTLLRSSYALTRIGSVTSLVSRNEKALKLPFVEPGLRKELDYQDLSGGGLGGCGTSCSTQCGDGSACVATCSPPRCAKCSCPASCSCS